MKYLLAVLIIGYAIFGVFPKRVIPSDVDSIVIEKFVSGSKSPVDRVVLNYNDAVWLSEDVGYLWCNSFIFNSWDESPHYWLTIDYDGITQEKIFVNYTDFDDGCISSNEVVKHLEKRLSNKALKQD
jgi:hypothetical protein